MITNYRLLRFLLALSIAVPLITGFSQPLSATVTPEQNGCGIIDSPDDLAPPLDPDDSRMVQPFGRVSGRFDGKLHAGEDWIMRRGTTLGSPVHAIGPGRVTFSDPLAWGRDKGVVIVQHYFADGSSMFSFYGHMEELNGIEFVEGGSCVEKGDVVGAIGSPRPAPHLHFEIRNFLSNAPGPGYWDVDPRLRGWQNPSQFITNWQGWLSAAHLWHRTLQDDQGPTVPNLMRVDGVVLMVDGTLIRAYSPEGRIWEYRLPDSIEPIALIKHDDDTMILASRDGRLQYWNQYGGFLNEWDSGLGEFDQEPIRFGELTLLRTPDDLLSIYDANLNLIRRYADIPDILSYAHNDDMLVMITNEPRLLLMNPAGEMMDRQDIQRGSDVIANGSGNGFYLRDRDTLYFLDQNGKRETILEDLSVNRSDDAMILTSNGWLVTWGINGRERLMALDPRNGNILWETDIEDVTPTILGAQLVQADACTVALADRRGRVFTFAVEDGQAGGRVTIWGNHLNQIWLGSYADDEILRVHIGNQLAGFDTRILSGWACDQS